MSGPLHHDRSRATSFGSAAARYDLHRPRYPGALIADLVDRQGIRVLDVGAGTGIAGMQMRDAGADVLAVEPDPQMADIAAAKGLAVEVATFEEWDAQGRPLVPEGGVVAAGAVLLSRQAAELAGGFAPGHPL